jgi:hypothetical protein
MIDDSRGRVRVVGGERKEDETQEMDSEWELSRAGGGANGGWIGSYSTLLGTVATENRSQGNMGDPGLADRFPPPSFRFVDAAPTLSSSDV